MVETSLWGAILGPVEECRSSDEMWGFVLYPLIMLYCFYILARICDGHLTQALEFIVERVQLSEDVAGATFLAMASSAPELFTSIMSTFVVVSETGAGNIVGSAVFNLLVIIGVVPVFAGQEALRIWWYPTARDAVFYSLSIVELGAVLADGKVYWWEGLIMLLSYFCYVFYFTQNSRIIAHLGISPPSKEADGAEGAPDKDASGKSDSEKPGEGAPKLKKGESSSGSKAPGWQSGNSESSSDSLGNTDPRKHSRSSNSFSLRGAQKTELNKMSKVVPSPDETSVPKTGKGGTNSSQENDPEVTGHEEPQEGSPQEANEEAVAEEEEEDAGWCKYEPIMLVINMTMPTSPERLYTLFALCCLWIGIFTYFAVDTGGRLGKCLLHIPDVVMGLVVFAAGTSVPDAMGSIAVAKDGMGDMAVANAVGSNTFDILLGLGLPWFLKGAITGEPVMVGKDMLTEAIIILAGCLVFYLVMLNCNQWILTKKLGLLLVAMYVCVIIFLLIWYQVTYA